MSAFVFLEAEGCRNLDILGSGLNTEEEYLERIERKFGQIVEKEKGERSAMMKIVNDNENMKKIVWNKIAM